MDSAFRIIGRALASVALFLGRRALVLAGRAARLAGRAGVGAGIYLVLWAVRRPRSALGAGVALSLGAVMAAVLWPAPRLDLEASLDCLALNIYHEARGEPAEGKIAVGQVVMNRVGDPHFPARVCEVVKQGGERPFDRCQFSWWCDGRNDRPDDPDAWEDSKYLAKMILAGALEDPTRGALWYHADDVTPGWRMDMVRRGKIGQHIFYVRQSR